MSWKTEVSEKKILQKLEPKEFCNFWEIQNIEGIDFFDLFGWIRNIFHHNLCYQQQNLRRILPQKSFTVLFFFE